MTSIADYRTPLEPTTNETHISPSNRTDAITKRGPELRHKFACKVLKSDLNSSESCISPHPSIYDASVIPSAENLDYDSYDFATRPSAIEEAPQWDSIVVGESGDGVPSSFLLPPSTKNTHVPHALFPITERSSYATIRTSASFSINGRSSTTTLRPRSPGLNGKRSKSFSVSDLPPYHSPSPPPSPPSPLPAPILPHQPPPERTSTPPGLPTFNKPEALNYRLPAPQHRRGENSVVIKQAHQEWKRQTIGLPRGVVMRGEDGLLVRGKFTPIVSGHVPPQRQAHAFYRAMEMAPMTESAHDEGGNRRRAESRPADQAHEARTGRKVKIDEGLKKAVWFFSCCGLWDERYSNDENSDRGQRSRSPRDAPLFVGSVIPPL